MCGRTTSLLEGRRCKPYVLGHQPERERSRERAIHKFAMSGHLRPYLSETIPRVRAPTDPAHPCQQRSRREPELCLRNSRVSVIDVVILCVLAALTSPKKVSDRRLTVRETQNCDHALSAGLLRTVIGKGKFTKSCRFKALRQLKACRNVRERSSHRHRRSMRAWREMRASISNPPQYRIDKLSFAIYTHQADQKSACCIGLSMAKSLNGFKTRPSSSASRSFLVGGRGKFWTNALTAPIVAVSTLDGWREYIKSQLTRLIRVQSNNVTGRSRPA